MLMQEQPSCTRLLYLTSLNLPVARVSSINVLKAHTLENLSTTLAPHHGRAAPPPPYHAGENGYKRNREINSKTMSVRTENYRKIVTGLIISKIQLAKLKRWRICQTEAPISVSLLSSKRILWNFHWKRTMVDGLLAKIGIAILLPVCSSPFTTGLPVLCCAGFHL